MPNTYEYTNEDGGIIRIEATGVKRATTRGGGSEAIVKKVQMSFEKALGTVKAATTGLKKVIDEANPDEASIEFSLKAGGEAGFFSICRAATEAEFKITLTWKNENK